MRWTTRSPRAGSGRRRSDGKLPAHVTTYLTLGLALFPDDDYTEVATKVTGSLDKFGCWDAAWSVPTSSAITQARKRLGRRMFAELFQRVGGPVAGPVGMLADRTAVGTARGSFLRGWRLVAIDGFEVDLPDSAENAAEFGYAGSGDNRSAFPKARVVALAECGTHAFLTAEIDAYKVGEKTLAQRVYPRLRTDRAAGRGPQLLLLPGVGHRRRDRRRPALAGPDPTLVAGGPGACRRHLPQRGHGLEDPRRPPQEDPGRREQR